MKGGSDLLAREDGGDVEPFGRMRCRPIAKLVGGDRVAFMRAPEELHEDSGAQYALLARSFFIALDVQRSHRSDDAATLFFFMGPPRKELSNAAQYVPRTVRQ